MIMVRRSGDTRDTRRKFLAIVLIRMGHPPVKNGRLRPLQDFRIGVSTEDCADHFP